MERDEHWHDRLWRFLRTPLGRGITALGMAFGPVHLHVADNQWHKDPNSGAPALPPDRREA